MKLYDFDGMFDEKLTEYISKNSGKHTEEEWEDIIPELYKKFGDTPIKSIGKTPRQFYAEMSAEELVKCLKVHIKQEVPVSVFLCEAIEEKTPVENLLPLLDGAEGEREYAMNLIGSADCAIKKYLNILVASDDEELKDRCADLIKEKADLVAKEALEYCNKGKDKEFMLEILSRTVIKDDKIFDVLLKAFRSDGENLPMHASYLATYGDERAIPYLLDRIEDEGITFVEFRELKFAIEALGGEYTKPRDFSGDPYYDIITSHNSQAEDLFKNFNK